MKPIRIWLLLVSALAASYASAADRHVYLNTSGTGIQLNDCPNPAHAADGTAAAAELQYCPTTIPMKLICDPGGSKVCKPWTVTSASCPVKLPLTSSTALLTLSVDVDGDGAAEAIYGSPQACVWGMDPSDACDVHAGTYQRGGTMADWNVAGSPGVTDRSDCWIATVGALGHGRNPAIGTDGQGYGTSSNPAYLRGAQLDANRDGDVLDAHEIDTWDENGNKIPDRDEGLTSYAAVFSGDANGNGTPKEPSVCSTSGAVGGDAFYPLMWGCGSGSAAATEVCRTNISGAQTRPKIDTDADGTFDKLLPGGPRDVSNFVMKNIEATGYGGGPTSCSGNGVREKLGHFSLGGDGSSGGFVADGIYFHHNAYSNLCAPEHYVAVFGDDENGECAKDHEIKNSNIVQDNRFTINDDSDSWGTGTVESGCGWYMHDNRVDIVSNPGCSGQSCRKGFLRLKSVDSLQNGTRKKQFRIVNNDFTWQTTTTDQNFPWFIQTECIGECGPYNPGLGELWFYGNVFHYRAGAAGATLFGGYSCTSDGSPDSHAFRFYSFNNTWDGARGGAESTQAFGALCNSTGEIIVSRNNAFYRSTSVNTTAGDTKRFSNDRCTESGQVSCTQSNTSGSGGTPRSNWWTTGTWGVTASASLANYVPRTGGPLDNTGSCDPDGDGIQGVDYDNNPATGVNGQETTWKDIAGNVVDCSTSGNPSQAIDIGAIQNASSGSGSNPAPAIVTGLQRKDVR